MLTPSHSTAFSISILPHFGACLKWQLSGKRYVVFREQLEAYLTNCCANLTPVWPRQRQRQRQMQRQRREQVLSQQHLCAGNFTTLAKNKTSLLLRSAQAMLQIIRSRYVQCACEQRSLLRRRLHQDLKSSSKGNEGEDEEEQQQRGRRERQLWTACFAACFKKFPIFKGGRKRGEAGTSKRKHFTYAGHTQFSRNSPGNERGGRGTNIYISNTKFWFDFCVRQQSSASWAGKAEQVTDGVTARRWIRPETYRVHRMWAKNKAQNFDLNCLCRMKIL